MAITTHLDIVSAEIVKDAESVLLIVTVTVSPEACDTWNTPA